jgi:hypothetical protein
MENETEKYTSKMTKGNNINNGSERLNQPGRFCNTKKRLGPAHLTRKNFDPNTGNKILKPKEDDALLSAGRIGVNTKSHYVLARQGRREGKVNRVGVRRDGGGEEAV